MTGVRFGQAVARAGGVDGDAYEEGRAFFEAMPKIDSVFGFSELALFWIGDVGWKIFPLYEAHRGPHPGKTPSDLLGSGWTAEDVGSNDADQIVKWWYHRPFSNMGLVTRANKLLVLDVDGRHGGWERLVAWCGEHGIDLSRVPRSVSPRGDGGAHLYWHVPEGWRGVEDPEGRHVDYVHSPLLRGVDRPWQVPLPPSMRFVTVDSGARDPDQMNDYRPYRWEVGDPRRLPEAPEVLLDPPRSEAEFGNASFVIGGGARSGVGASGPSLEAPEGGWSRAGGRPVAQGEQNSAFFRIACSLSSKNVAIEEAYAVVWETALASPQNPDDPWSYAQVCRQVNRAYRRISEAKEKQREHNRAVAARLLGGSGTDQIDWTPTQLRPEDL